MITLIIVSLLILGATMVGFTLWHRSIYGPKCYGCLRPRMTRSTKSTGWSEASTKNTAVFQPMPTDAAEKPLARGQ
jgi:hypothetical protein